MGLVLLGGMFVLFRGFQVMPVGFTVQVEVAREHAGKSQQRQQGQ